MGSNVLLRITSSSSILIVLFSLLFPITVSSGSATSEDSRMGVTFEFKIVIDAGKQECFYQWIESGASLYVAFQVVRSSGGNDNHCGFYIHDPNGYVVLPYVWHQHAELDLNTVNTGGYYQLCIDNQQSRYQSKVVSLYVSSLKADEWAKYVDEWTQLDSAATNATHVLRNVQMNINEVLKHIDQAKQRLSYDYHLIWNNNRRIYHWSAAQTVLMVLCSVLQVYFVRKFFATDEQQKRRVRA